MKKRKMSLFNLEPGERLPFLKLGKYLLFFFVINVAYLYGNPRAESKRSGRQEAKYSSKIQRLKTGKVSNQKFVSKEFRRDRGERKLTGEKLAESTKSSKPRTEAKGVGSRSSEVRRRRTDDYFFINFD